MAQRYAGANHPSLKRNNAAAIFRAIHELGPIARVDLARHTGLNPATVSHVVDVLIAQGIASETGFRSSGRAGRKAIELVVNPSGRLAIGIDLARRDITGALVNLSGHVVEQIVEPTPSPWDAATAFPVAQKMVDRLLASLPSADRRNVVGVGMGVPVPTTVRDNQLLAWSEQGWTEIGATKEFQQVCQLPLRLDNNAKTSTLAELWFGIGRRVDNFVLLNIGVGVGAGVVVSGDLYRGEHELAGEVAHLIVNADGQPCSCGGRGCLQQYVSSHAIVGAAHDAINRGGQSRLRDEPEITIDAVIAALHDGDPVAEDVFGQVARYLAAGIGNVVTLLDPSAIVIGRDLAAAGHALLDRVKDELRARHHPGLSYELVQLEVATVPDEPVVGAATLALREFFRAPLDTPEPANTAVTGGK